MRKKFDHVSTLHVIHHGIMPMSVWFGVKFCPGGHSTFFGFLNTFVHIIMYSYYLIAALGPQYQKFLWWKKYLTTIQMVRWWAKQLHSVILRLLNFRSNSFWLWSMPSNCSSLIATILKHSSGGLECMPLCFTFCSQNSTRKPIKNRKIKWWYVLET